jgi:hypothetical protein
MAGGTVPASAPSMAMPPPIPNAAVSADVKKLMTISKQTVVSDTFAGNRVKSNSGIA